MRTYLPTSNFRLVGMFNICMLYIKIAWNTTQSNTKPKHMGKQRNL